MLNNIVAQLTNECPLVPQIPTDIPLSASIVIQDDDDNPYTDPNLCERLVAYDPEDFKQMLAETYGCRDIVQSWVFRLKSTLMPGEKERLVHQIENYVTNCTEWLSWIDNFGMDEDNADNVTEFVTWAQSEFSIMKLKYLQKLEDEAVALLAFETAMDVDEGQPSVLTEDDTRWLEEAAMDADLQASDDKDDDAWPDPDVGDEKDEGDEGKAHGKGKAKVVLRPHRRVRWTALNAKAKSAATPQGKGSTSGKGSKMANGNDTAKGSTSGKGSNTANGNNTAKGSTSGQGSKGSTSIAKGKGKNQGKGKGKGKTESSSSSDGEEDSDDNEDDEAPSQSAAEAKGKAKGKAVKRRRLKGKTCPKP